MNNLGVIAYNKQDFQVAMSYWTRLLKVNPKNADALQNSGAVYVQMGDLKKALEYLEAANLVAPNNPNTVKNLKFVKEKLQAF